jgi:hypothetical protein
MRDILSAYAIISGFTTVEVNGKENKIHPALLNKAFCLSSTIRGSGALEIKHWLCRETRYLNCFNVPHLTLHSGEAKQKRVQPAPLPAASHGVFRAGNTKTLGE